MEKICEYLFENKEHIRDGEYVKLMELVKEAQEKEVDVYRRYVGVLVVPNEFDRFVESYKLTYTTKNEEHNLGKYNFEFDGDLEPTPDTRDTDPIVWNRLVRDNQWLEEKLSYLKDSSFGGAILILFQETVI